MTAVALLHPELMDNAINNTNLQRSRYLQDKQDFPDTSYSDQYTIQSTTYTIQLHRNPFDVWCGYIILPQTDNANAITPEDIDTFQVHGGITYGNADSDMIGFDCSHLGDWWKDHPAPGPQDVYRDYQYTYHQCVLLAHQIHHLITTT